MSVIQQLYYPDDEFGPGERAYLLELRSWLEAQPQDAWLLYVTNINADSMDEIVSLFIDNPDCDIAVIALLFWSSDPAYWLTAPKAQFEGSLVQKIIKNLALNFYQRAELALDEKLVAPYMQTYAAKRKKANAEELLFEAPAKIFGPFGARKPVLSDKPDAATIAHLKEIYAALGISSNSFWFEA